MFDASGKIPDGISVGNTYALGSYEACMQVIIPISKQIKENKEKRREEKFPWLFVSMLFETLLETKIEIENLLNCVDSIFCKIIIKYVTILSLSRLMKQYFFVKLLLSTILSLSRLMKMG